MAKKLAGTLETDVPTAIDRCMDEGFRVKLRLHAGSVCHVELRVQRFEHCPICFEEVDKLIQLPHPSALDGVDVSRHCLCAACNERWSGGCPFCRCPAPMLVSASAVRLTPWRASLTFADRLLSRVRRRSNASRAAAQQQRTCRGCRRGCLQCDPHGLRMWGDDEDADDWFRMENC